MRRSSLLISAVLVSLLLPVPGARTEESSRAPGIGGGAPGAGEKAAAAIGAEKLREHVSYLASDELLGRDSGEPGLEVAAEYIANRFREYGLLPAGDDGTYFHRFTVPFGAGFGRIAGAVVSTGKGGEIKLAPGTDVFPFGYGETGSGAIDAPAVFAGYGVTAGEEDRKQGLDYDDYAGLDVKGKVVILLRHVPGLGQENRPRGSSPEKTFGGRRSPHAPFLAKLRNAREHGAAGVIFATAPGQPPEAPENDPAGIAHRAAPRQPTLPSLIATTEAAGAILGAAGKDLETAVREIDETFSPRSFELDGVRIRLDTTPGHRLLRNVAGRLPGRGDHASESVVVGAHYDHIGRFGNQVDSKNLGRIHNGADDNASGTAGVLELARVFAREPDRVGRAIVFLCFSAEEIGLLGSRAWLDAPRRFVVKEEAPRWKGPEGGAEDATFPRGTIVEAAGSARDGLLEVQTPLTRERRWTRGAALEQLDGPEPLHRIAAMINLDMIGRLKDGASVSVLGAESSRAFPPLLEEVSKRLEIAAEWGGKGAFGGGSDHESFLQRGIPVLFFFTGIHGDYNTPGDDPGTLNYEGERRVLELVRASVGAILTAPERPQFDTAALAARRGGHGRPKLGVEIESEAAGGARVRRVVPDSLAEKGGVKEGDVILSLGSVAVRNAEELVGAVEGAPQGEELKLRVRRAEGDVDLKVMFPAPRGGFRVVFGSVPDYGFAERGVRFEAIRPGTPAEKGGVLPGDVLVRWNGKAHTGYGLPFAIYLLRNFMGSLPREVFESAAIDGASPVTAFFRLAIPMSVPAIAALAIFQFLFVWNDLLVALIYISAVNSENLPLTVSIANLVTSTGGGTEFLGAAAFLSMLLPLVVFFALQRYFVRGIVGGSVKG